MAEGHRGRVRDRLLSDETMKIPEYVILEAYLHGVVVRKDTHALANRLLKEFGTFAQVVDAPLETLMEVEGVGKSVAQYIKMLPAFLRRYVDSKFKELEVAATSDDLGMKMLPYFIGEMQEKLYAMYLNNSGKILGCDFVQEGGMSMVQVTARKILAGAMKYHATGVVLAHNHPNGIAVPSDEDLMVTRKLKEVLLGSELVLIDHLIMEDEDFTSIRESMTWAIWPEGPYRNWIGAK